ncbi:MAG: hypothetical protein QNJ88_13145 [Acidimicrobiia bacterium]|nr:hypothetical protein [Acidimicrobiia bacterium]
MNSAAGRPWEGIDLWRSHKQFRETLSEAEEAEFDEYLDEARPAELEERRAELEEEFPDIDLDSPIPEELFHTLPGEDLDRLIDWQYDKALLDDREREASAEEFAATMAAIADADPAADREERPEFGPRPPLSPQERFEIGFRTKGEITPEMRAWEIAADRALSDQFGQQVVGQWVFGMSDPMLLSEGEELPEGAEVIGPAGEGYPGGRMIRIPTARRKYRIAKDGEFLGQFAYDDRQAASLLYVTFYQNAGTYNLPTSYGVLVDVSTDRIFNTSTSRAPKDVMDAVRADNNGGLWLVDDLSRPDPRWIAAEPKNVDEAMSAMAERIAPKGLVAEWVNDPNHDLNPAARRYRRGLFPPVKDTQPDLSPQATPDDSADGASGSATDNEGSTVDELFGPTPQHLQDLDNIPEGTKPEVDWGDGESLFDEDHEDAELSAADRATSVASSFLSGRMLVFVALLVVILGAILAATWLGSGNDEPQDRDTAASESNPLSALPNAPSEGATDTGRSPAAEPGDASAGVRVAFPNSPAGGYAAEIAAAFGMDADEVVGCLANGMALRGTTDTELETMENPDVSTWPAGLADRYAEVLETCLPLEPYYLGWFRQFEFQDPACVRVMTNHVLANYSWLRFLNEGILDRDLRPQQQSNFNTFVLAGYGEKGCSAASA